MIYASLSFVIVLHVFLFRKRGLVDPVSVFFLAFLYYSYLAPITMIYFGVFSVDFAGNANWVSSEEMEKSGILFAVGYLGFSLSYFVLSGDRKYLLPSLNKSIRDIVGDGYIKSLLMFIFFTIFILLTVYRDALSASTDSYDGKISGNYSNSGYAFFMSLALTLLSLTINYIILNAKNYIIASTFGVLTFFTLTILTFSKYPLIFAALCIFCAFHRYRKIPYIVLIFGLVVGAIATTVIFIPMFSIFRSTGQLEFLGFSYESLSVMLGEASSPFLIVSLGFKGYIQPDGHPLWHSFALWIPRAIWVDRPLDIAEGFAQQVLVNWQAGFGLGFSPFAEAYARVGLFGSFLFMGLVGGLMALLQRGFAMLLPLQMRTAATLTIGGIVSVLVLRGAFSGLITQSLQNWIPVIFVSVVARQLASRATATSASHASD